MKNNKVRIILAFVSLFSLNNICLSNELNTGLYPVLEPVADIGVKAGVDSGDVVKLYDSATSGVSFVSQVFERIIKDVKHLDFDLTSKFSIQVPGIDQEIVYDWGFAGSGDLFSPLVSIKPELRTASGSKNGQDNFMLELGKAVAQDHAQQIGQNIPVLDKLLKMELTPKILFSLKTVLLLKKIGSIGIEKIQADLLRLFIRLSQSEEFKLLGENTTLSSYLPSWVISSIDKASPSLMIFANEIFDVFAGGGSINEIDKNNKIVSVSGFTFNDKAKANAVFENIKNIKNINFVSEMSKAIERVELQQESYEVFETFKNMENSKLVGFKDFGSVQNSNLLENLKKEALRVSTFPSVIKIEDGDESWILYVTDKFGATQTLRLLISSLMQTFNDYKSARSNYFKENATQDVKLRKLLDEQQRKIAKIDKFLQTRGGKDSKQRVEEALKNINEEFAVNREVSGLQAELNELGKKEKECENLISESSMLNNQGEQEIKKILKLVAEKEKIQEQKNFLISKIEKAKKQSDAKPQKDELQKVLADIKELEELEVQMKFEDQDVKELQDAISELKEKGEQLKGRDDSGLSLQDRLQKREKIAQAYSKEVEILHHELRQIWNQVEIILDPSKKRIENFKFVIARNQYELRMHSLEQEAQKIRDENKKVSELISLRNIQDLNSEEQQRVRALEAEVGYIVTGKQCVSSVMTYLQKNKEMNEFMRLVNSEISEYQGIKEVLIKRLEFLAANSDYIRNNRAALNLLIKKIFPEFPITF